jgi:oligogalacturonide lyase
MARGTIHQEPLHPFTDPVSGRRVVRLTDPATHCHHSYFYHFPFTPDSRRLVYVSNRTGHRNLFLLDLATGESRQLTDARRLVDFHFEVAADGRRLLYAEENQLRWLDLETLTESTIHVQTHPWNRRSVYPGFSADLSQALLCQIHADDLVPAGAAGWDSFPRQFEAKPRCRHGSGCRPRINADTGGFSTQDAHPHPLFAPDGNTVIFTSDLDTGPEGNCAVYLADATGLGG